LYPWSRGRLCNVPAQAQRHDQRGSSVAPAPVSAAPPHRLKSDFAFRTCCCHVRYLSAYPELTNALMQADQLECSSTQHPACTDTALYSYVMALKKTSFLQWRPLSGNMTTGCG
jgi:hypothetical protein